MRVRGLTPGGSHFGGASRGGADIGLNTEWVFLIRWFKFTLKPPNRITCDKLQLAIWDTSFWSFWLKFGHKGP